MDQMRELQQQVGQLQLRFDELEKELRKVSMRLDGDSSSEEGSQLAE